MALSSLMGPGLLAKENCISPGSLLCRDPDIKDAKSFTTGQPGVVLRQPAGDRLQDLADLTNAYRQMKQDTSSPTGWLGQACFHRWASKNLAIHDPLRFLIWHRGFLYFHERILGKLSDKDVRVPFWHWDVPHDSTSTLPLPGAYTSGTPDTNPLNTCCRSQTYVHGNAVTCDDVVNTSLGEEDYLLFSRNLERVPHSMIHLEIHGYMADWATSPLDPIFYAHHSNVDRLLVTWLNMGGKRCFPPSSDNNYNQPLYFYDETGQVVKVFPEQLHDHRSLGYDYAPVTGSCSDTPGWGPALDSFEFGSGVQEPSSIRKFLASYDPARYAFELALDEIHGTAAPGLFRVFAGTGNRLSAGSPGYVGSVAELRSSHHAHHGSDLAASFDVTARLDQLLDSRNELNLSIVRVDERGRAGAPRRLSAKRGRLIVHSKK
jgi:hypothetical protein